MNFDYQINYPILFLLKYINFNLILKFYKNYNLKFLIYKEIKMNFKKTFSKKFKNKFYQLLIIGYITNL